MQWIVVIQYTIKLCVADSNLFAIIECTVCRGELPFKQ